MTVTVFVASGCPHSAALLDDLRRRRVDYHLVDLVDEPDRVRELAAVTRERRVPVVVDHERCSIGFRGRSTSLEVLGMGRLAILAREGGVAGE